ncbi:tRNA (adenosine(37)-N6)-threonylcarbamoyltransferase complex dimerization subunit type 1 TsaB [Crenobacter sp. SG2303]|uniref:tRNA (Adenosine(37)-N6)-threonylcarbamoyltransferase complex dimerization subunit type 1 TsaB n=1 Tax=Crenobacter oryzisoli TaxID=3056844 RepID=A0ABT7XP15_9NEIS|nr:tRNA (adenosine(37)-N6)-threonylcarbamoyltransferase complex dimerization subunit type 1 TsaB [Crenobacter sp. SG2303]MDN0075506.1 tRNA (adenosine(37)-N6)-threonylcarbamoyltransferase complex dimerization subunit type 1 TsaB [Crenobacter sp. SG2303]
MKLLALDTSTQDLSLAIQNGEQRVEFHETVGQQHAERALPELQKLLDAAGLKLGELDAIVYGQGPGSFTGLRIGAGLAQGLAVSASLPLIGIPTLDAVAAQAPATERLLVCLDARMQEVYVGHYDTRHGVRRQGPIELLDPAELRLTESGWIAAGNGLSVYADRLPENLTAQLARQLPELRPSAAAYLDLAGSGAYPSLDASSAELLYVRNKVALTAREQQAQRR